MNLLPSRSDSQNTTTKIKLPSPPNEGATFICFFKGIIPFIILFYGIVELARRTMTEMRAISMWSNDIIVSSDDHNSNFLKEFTFISFHKKPIRHDSYGLFSHWLQTNLHLLNKLLPNQNIHLFRQPIRTRIQMVHDWVQCESRDRRLVMWHCIHVSISCEHKD